MLFRSDPLHSQLVAVATAIPLDLTRKGKLSAEMTWSCVERDVVSTRLARPLEGPVSSPKVQVPRKHQRRRSVIRIGEDQFHSIVVTSCGATRLDDSESDQDLASGGVPLRIFRGGRVSGSQHGMSSSGGDDGTDDLSDRPDEQHFPSSQSLDEPQSGDGSRERNGA